MRIRTIFAPLLAIGVLASATALKPLHLGPSALEQAIAQADTVMLQGPEGIWEYPGEDVVVSILGDHSGEKGKYCIRVVEAFDTRLHPGDLLGMLAATAKPGEYELLQYTRRNKNLLDLPGKCLVTLTSDSRSLLIAPSSRLALSLNPTSLLPKFWRTVRLTVNESNKQAAEGLIRIYPSGDGKGIPYSKKRYL